MMVFSQPRCFSGFGRVLHKVLVALCHPWWVLDVPISPDRDWLRLCSQTPPIQAGEGQELVEKSSFFPCFWLRAAAPGGRWGCRLGKVVENAQSSQDHP